MRRTLILTLAALVCALAVCAASVAALNGVLDEAQALRAEAEQAALRGEADRALGQTARLAGLLRARRGLMELLTGHDGLRDVEAAVADARICLERGDLEDGLRALACAAAGLERLRDEQAVRWENLC